MRYKIKMTECCIAIKTMLKGPDINIDVTSFKGGNIRDVECRIDKILCQFCPFCGKEVEFELIKE